MTLFSTPDNGIILLDQFAEEANYTGTGKELIKGYGIAFLPSYVYVSSNSFSSFSRLLRYSRSVLVLCNKG